MYKKIVMWVHIAPGNVKSTWLTTPLATLASSLEVPGWMTEFVTLVWDELGFGENVFPLQGGCYFQNAVIAILTGICGYCSHIFYSTTVIFMSTCKFAKDQPLQHSYLVALPKLAFTIFTYGSYDTDVYALNAIFWCWLQWHKPLIDY